MTSPGERECWLALLHAKGAGPLRIRRLLEARPGGVRALFEPGPRDGDNRPGGALAAALRAPDWNAVERDLAWEQEAPDHTLLTPADAGYPHLLRQLPDPPHALYVRGECEVLGTPQLAVVGSRKPSPYGLARTRELVHALAATGLTVTSGLALGIDARAHEAALEVGGATVAVTATGIDRIYPRGHHRLAEQIVAHGALLTEFPLGTPPRPAHFPRRNRLISGLSLGTLVVEATPRSGSLITARHALEQNREVFAVPGPINHAGSRGCHALIKQGAKLTEEATDVLEELPPLGAPRPPATAATPAPAGAPDPTLQRLLDLVGAGPASVDTLIEHSGLTTAEVCSMLCTLELEGRLVAAEDGNYWRAD